MKARTMLYTALGFATYKTGKLLGKRKVRQAVRDLRGGQGRRHTRRHA